MHPRIALAATLSTVALGAAPQLPQAQAEIMASGTRLSIAGGPVRSYMTYGHAAEPELYAPIIQELRRVQVTFQRDGDDLVLFYKGTKVDRWPLIHARDEVPENGECVLALGGNLFVPVRAIAERFNLDVKWDKGSNVVALVPSQKRTNVVARPGTSRVPTGLVALKGIRLEEKDGSLLVQVDAASAVRPNWFVVKSPAPTRIVFDFARAQWADGVQPPAGSGLVKQARIGYPTPTTARLVLEVPSLQEKVTAVVVTEDSVVATLGRGVETRRMVVTEEAAKIFAVRDRAKMVQLSGRGGIDGTFVLPAEPFREEPSLPSIPSPSVERPELPDRAPELRVRPAGTLRGKRIVVDAGHGGHHSGAKGLNNLEKDLCLKMARELEQSLEGLGATVIMTRTSDVFVSLDDRCTIANRSNADIFISIHCNSMPRRNMQSGTETYWHSSQKSNRLARAIHPWVVRAVSGRDGGVRNRSFQVIRETSMPSVLLEIAYINNTQDEILLATESFHKKLADNIARGVLDYFGTDVASN